jgi:hypothetical protein
MSDERVSDARAVDPTSVEIAADVVGGELRFGDDLLWG